jgi:hypothetical protein
LFGKGLLDEGGDRRGRHLGVGFELEPIPSMATTPIPLSSKYLAKTLFSSGPPEPEARFWHRLICFRHFIDGSLAPHSLTAVHRAILPRLIGCAP